MHMTLDKAKLILMTFLFYTINNLYMEISIDKVE